MSAADSAACPRDPRKPPARGIGPRRAPGSTSYVGGAGSEHRSYLPSPLRPLRRLVQSAWFPTRCPSFAQLHSRCQASPPPTLCPASGFVQLGICRNRARPHRVDTHTCSAPGFCNRLFVKPPVPAPPLLPSAQPTRWRHRAEPINSGEALTKERGRCQRCANGERSVWSPFFFTYSASGSGEGCRVCFAGRSVQ